LTTQFSVFWIPAVSVGKGENIMAINPNTDFSVGAVLTAAQQNRFPRGVMALGESTTFNSSVTAEAVQISTSFTAVADRYYKITYFEPGVASGTGYFTFRIRQGTTTAGTQLQAFYDTTGTGVDRHANGFVVKTFSAGTVQLVGTASQSAGTGAIGRAANQPAFLLVEDIGPA
jgi:hypothetical protein